MLNPILIWQYAFANFMYCRSEARSGTAYHNQSDHNVNLSADNSGLDDNKRLYIFLGITAGFIISSLARSLVISSFTYTASVVLHDAMFAKILRAPIVFFERNPVGMLLSMNRGIHFFATSFIYIDM